MLLCDCDGSRSLNSQISAMLEKPLDFATTAEVF
jgi:hypothetical protein